MDYRKYAADELRHIEELRTAERICQDRLADLTVQLHSLKIPTPQTDPVQGGGSKTEDRWLNIITAQVDEEIRLKHIRRRIKRFNTAWNILSDRDKAVLTEFYIAGRIGSAERFANREHCDRSTAFRWRDEALVCFTRAFYGEIVT